MTDEDLTPEEMKMQFLYALRSKGVTDKRVLTAMEKVDRGAFITGHFETRAYEDMPLPIACGQTISQPYVVAKMTEALLDGFEGQKVLEIGTGCGYQTAVLASLVKKIYSVERIPELLRRAKQRLRDLDIYNVQFRPGDGWKGWPKYAPYDGIIVAAAAPVTLPGGARGESVT